MSAAGPGSPGRLRLLTFSTLFPHPGQPNHGVFVANRLRHLAQSGAAESTVLAPVPWFPAAAARMAPGWAHYARVPAEETRDGIRVLHPRYLVVPKLGMNAAPLLLYAAARAALGRMLRDGFAFDAIDAHYLYPDGVAAVLLARWCKRPVVITARGSDVTQLPDFALPRRAIQWAMREADALISVSAGLREAMVRLGAAPDKITVLRNGVDLQGFQPQDRIEARAALGITGPTLLSVGLLIERKGHHRTIAALPHLPGWRLLILGEGPERPRLEALARELGVGDRVQLLGARPHAELPRYYSAADAMVLASSREGWANVLLESMACGTPVVASPIPGNPEVVQAAAAGVIMDENTAAGVARGVLALMAARRPSAETRAYSERFSWDETSAGQVAVFRQVLAKRSVRSGQSNRFGSS